MLPRTIALLQQALLADVCTAEPLRMNACEVRAISTIVQHLFLESAGVYCSFLQRYSLSNVPNVPTYLTHHLPPQTLVRISLACFRRTSGKRLDTNQGGCDEPVGPGHCLRALLTHIWWKLHDSSELALNGVRAGGARHRSSIQKVLGVIENKPFSAEAFAC